MCLLMLPVLYNALALSEEDRHRSSPLFGALHAALQASSYAALVFSPPQGWPGEAALYPAQPLFLGPSRPSACLAKYVVQPAGKPKRKRGTERGGSAASVRPAAVKVGVCGEGRWGLCRAVCVTLMGWLGMCGWLVLVAALLQSLLV